MTAHWPLRQGGTFLLLGLLAIVAPSAATAVPIYFEPNGHYYEYIQASQITWTDAYADASQLVHEGMTGYLASLTSEAENQVVYEAFGDLFSTAWLGGYQDPTSIPGEQWHWITDEDWAYTNWANGEPNDAGGSDKECYLQMLGSDSRDPGCWNDDAHSTHLEISDGFLVEFGGTSLPVPEPATLILVGLGLGTVAFTRRRLPR